jgi:hypothetical protein
LKNEKKTILMIGPLAPPFGGISIHIDRLSKLLRPDFRIDYVDESRNIKDGIFNIRSGNLFKYIKKLSKAKLVYIQSGSRSLRIFHLAMGGIFLKKMVLTIHSYRVINKPFSRYFDKALYRLADKIIFVNDDIRKTLALPIEKCIVKEAFIPPVMETEPGLPVHVTDWIAKRKNAGDIIACGNAWQLEIFNRQDLYGLDMIIEVAGRLAEKHYPISFVFNVSSLEKQKIMFENYGLRLKKSGLEDRFLLLNEKLSFVKLIELTDIVLRPTNTDGDALTVREALFLKKPVLSSDVVKRPAGTTLFKTRDSNDLEVKLKEIINGTDKAPEPMPSEYENRYGLFYKELVSGVMA